MLCSASIELAPHASSRLKPRAARFQETFLRSARNKLTPSPTYVPKAEAARKPSTATPLGTRGADDDVVDVDVAQAGAKLSDAVDTGAALSDDAAQAGTKLSEPEGGSSKCIAQSSRLSAMAAPDDTVFHTQFDSVGRPTAF